MNKKTLLIGGCALAVVAIVVALIFIFTGGEDAYRSIKVFEIDGSCKVDRGGDSLDAFKNMALSSGDSLTVGEGSFARLKLDDDKYVYLEANTKINLTATGTANDSKTMVYIERGSMLTEVKKKLSATSSYDIVTPNTTMSIRGTKTLTQVLEDAVTGHVQTSNAVLEGQVKIKAVKVKADGTVVSVEKDLGAGEGNAFSSNKEELVSQEEMKSIADTGASVNGIKVEIVSEEDADVVFDVATFEASFLENVKSILIADAEAATGEDGLSQEQIDAINAQLDEVLESFDVISTESQNAINAAASGEIEPETTPEITPEPTPEATSESVWSWENIAVTETDDTQDEGTTIVDGDTSLLVIDDADEADDTADRDNGADEVATEDDDNDDAADEDGEETDETDEDEVSDEENNAGEDDVDDADDEDKSDEEGEDENTDEEDADKEDGEDEEAEDEESEDEESEEERLAREEAERLEREAQEEAERLAAEQAQQEAQQSQSNTSSGGSTTTRQFTYNDSTTEVSLSMGSGSSASPIPVKVEFYTESGEGNNTVTHTYSVSSLPASGFTNGAALPGFDDQYSTRVVPADESVTQTNPEAWRVESYYAFTGWYTSQEDAALNDFSKRYTTYTSALDGKQLYPGIARTTTVFLHNSNYDMGYVSFSGDTSANIIRWEPVAEGVIAVVKAGSTITLPVAETHADSETVDHAYVKLKQPRASFYCYCEVSETDSEGFPDWSNGHPDFAELRLKEQTPDSATGTSHIYYTANRPELTVGSEDTFICLDMIYTAKVEIRVADFAGDNNGRVLIHKSFGSNNDYQLVGDFYSAFNSSNNGLCMLQGGNAEGSANWWKVTKASDTITSGNVTLDVYTFTTYYTGTYDRDNLYLPTFRIQSSSQNGYSKELLCNYKIKADGLVTTYKGDSSININQFTPEFNESEQFNVLKDIDGRYIFTVQPVDWVYIDMDPANAPGGVQSTSVFAVGENNPFVLPHDQSIDEYKYKFAINPVDLITDTGVQPSAPFNFTVRTGLIRNPGSGHNQMDTFIYAPDDIIYPFNLLGTARNTDYGTNPSAIYESGVIPEFSKKSYSYVGVQGYKLIGYKYYRVNHPGENMMMYLSDDGYADYPCVLNETNESVMNKVDLTEFGGLWENYIDFLGFVFTPVFAPLTQITATLTYNIPLDGDNKPVLTSQESVLGNYVLTLNNVDKAYIEKYGLELLTLDVDYANIQNANEFATDRLYARVGTREIVENEIHKYEVLDESRNSTGKYWTVTSGEHGLTLSTSLVNLPTRGVGTLDEYVDVQHLEKNKTFVRGINLSNGTYNASQDSLATYIPCSVIKVIPAQGESYKYSCFIYNNDFNRVFTAEDSFSTTPASPEGVTRTYYSPTIAARIMDMIGSDNYGWGYYGGVIRPYAVSYSNDQDKTFFGSASGEVTVGQVNSYTKDSLRKDSATNIYSYLGNSFAGGAGILEFKPYNTITIQNCNVAYIYDVQMSFDDNNDPGFYSITTIKPWVQQNSSFIWKRINDHIGDNVTDDIREISIAGTNYIYDVPEGFVYTSTGDGSGAIYIGTADYTITGQATPSSINAADENYVAVVDEDCFGAQF